MNNKIDRVKQIVLIVEGGGFKSAFTAGVLDTFIMSGYNPFHIYVGISGGAMNLTSFISNQYKRNIKIKKNTLDIATKYELFNLFNILENSLEEKLFFRVKEKKKLMIRNIRAMFGRTNLTTKEIQIILGMIKALKK